MKRKWLSCVELPFSKCGVTEVDFFRPMHLCKVLEEDCVYVCARVIVYVFFPRQATMTTLAAFGVVGPRYETRTAPHIFLNVMF